MWSKEVKSGLREIRAYFPLHAACRFQCVYAFGRWTSFCAYHSFIHTDAVVRAGWLTLAVRAQDECETALSHRLTATLLRLINSFQTLPGNLLRNSSHSACSKPALEPSLAVRLGLPAGTMRILAQNIVACSQPPLLAEARAYTSLWPGAKTVSTANVLRVGFVSADLYAHKSALLRTKMYATSAYRKSSDENRGAGTGSSERIAKRPSRRQAEGENNENLQLVSKDVLEESSSILSRNHVNKAADPLRTNRGVQISVHLFHSGTREDAQTAHLRANADSFHSVHSLSDREAARLMNDMGLHVLVDMNTHNRGGRLGIMHQKPAPVLVAYPDYPVSLCCSALDPTMQLVQHALLDVNAHNSGSVLK